MPTFNNVSPEMQQRIYSLKYHMLVFIKNATITGDSKGGLIIKDYRPSISILKGRKYEIANALGCSIYWDDGKPKKVSTRRYTDEQIDTLINGVGKRVSVAKDDLNLAK